MDQRETLAAALAGRYVVDREIGRGGMAVVFLARDIKHDRLVALKILSPELGAVVGVDRFLSEIRVTANLQHPNLLPLFDSGEADGQLYYVMPFVTGETLRARIEREKQLPVEEAIHIAVAVANALDYAHSHGVIHRDLKPENILLQHGEPMIADFGIALAISNAGGSRVTQTGLSLGTPQYMSPEQASGDRVIDGRSDIYSLSAILYEMLTGEPPHSGPTVQAIIAKVLTETPRGVRALRPSVPLPVERAIVKGLAKLPADRFATARQFIDALQHPTAGGHDVTADADGDFATTPRHSWLRHPASLVALGALVVGAILVAWLAIRPPRVIAPRVVQFSFPIPAGSRVGSCFGPIAATSPDGRRIAYIGPPSAGNEMWVRDLASDAPRVIPGSIDACQPQFSPDGQWLAWFNNARLMWFRTPVDGGPVAPMIRSISGIGIAWFKPDSIVYAPASLDAGAHIYRASVFGGTGARFLLDDSTAASTAQWNPIVAPDRQTLFFVSRRRAGGDELAFTTLDERRIHGTGVAARNLLGYTVGRVIYVQDDGALMALPFDLQRHVLRGPASATNDHVQLDAFGVKASLSPSGDLVYLGGSAAARAVLVEKGAPATPFVTEEKQYSYPRYSPDGKRIAFAIGTGIRTDIWIFTIASASSERLTSVGTDNERPEWTPDGRRILYRSNRTGQEAIWWQMADGSGTAEQLSPTLNISVLEAGMSPNGQTLLYRVDDPVRARDIYTMPLAGDKTPRPFLTTEFDELTPRFSPDGQWIAYVSNESGRDEVYLRPFPGPGGRALVSSGGGEEPVWSRDGRRIFYRSADAVVAASVSLAGNPAVTARDTIVTGPFLSSRFHPMYDVAPDGKRLLMLQGAATPVLTVVLNWADGLAAIVGAKK